MLSYFATMGRPHPELIRFVNYFDFTFRGERLGPVHQSPQDQHYGADDIKRAFQHGQSDGSIRAELDPTTKPFAIGNSIIGLVQRSQVAGLPGEPALTQEAIDLLVDVWRRHLIGPE